jgi:Tol biopolymer transport system component
LNLDLSPDGRVLAFYITGGIDSVWLYEIERETLTRWTSEWDHGNPLWAPNSREIAFGSVRPNAIHLYKQAVHGDGNAELLLTREDYMAPTSWSPDGAVLLLEARGVETGIDVWTLSLSDDGKGEPLLNERANEGRAAFSPNGKWIAYQSDETGRFEIYVRRFPSGGDKKLASTGGGDHPRWNPNGKELFYASGDKMMTVAVEAESELILGRPTMLFERRRNPDLPDYAVTPDGQRFIFIDDSVAEPAPTHLVLVQNFSEELNRLAPPMN